MNDIVSQINRWHKALVDFVLFKKLGRDKLLNFYFFHNSNNFMKTSSKLAVDMFRIHKL